MHLVHIGAHRTGTTSLQLFLEENKSRLLESSIHTFVPPETRQFPSVVLPKTGDIYLSEENILGTMENNIWQMSLYPDAMEFLDRHKKHFDGATAILLSIRDIADWWRSVILFSVERNLPLPTDAALAQIAKSKRNWVNVIKDVRSAFPEVEIFVREFQWKLDNPKQVLKHVSKDEALGPCRLNRRPQNSAPPYNRLIVSLFGRNDFDGLARIKSDLALALFSKDQIAQMDKRYDDDLRKIEKMDGVTLFIDRDDLTKAREGRRYLKPVTKPDPDGDTGPTCMLHIGKTGSDLLREAFGITTLLKSGTHLCGPDETLLTTLEKFGPYRKLVFFFRDPVQRFIDGFNGRMRQGRPKYHSPWSDGEAISFTYFATPNDLGEALFSEDERIQSAANYALEQLFHSKLDQAFFLVSPQAVDFEHSAGNIEVCCEFDKIEQHLPDISKALSQDVSNANWKTPEQDIETLSDLALKNLNRALEREIEIYEACKRVAADLGFDG